MARNGKSLQELAAEIERRASAKRDYIAPVSKIRMAAHTVKETGEVRPELVISNGGEIQMPMNGLAHNQMAEYLQIPAAYYRRLEQKDPGLLARNVNRWLQDIPEDRRMIRALDNNVRALLSDKYRPLDYEDLADTVFPVLADLNLQILSADITERRFYIKAVDKSVQRELKVGQVMGQGHDRIHVVAPAITIADSEVGSGALSIEGGILTFHCTNLASTGTAMRKFHTGKRADVSEEVYALLSDETKRKSDDAVWSQVRDLLKAAFDAAKFEQTVAKLQASTQDKLPVENVTEVIERVGKRFSFNEGERKGVMARLIEAGDFFRYGMHAAITRHSQEETVDYDRATEMERIGGQVIDLDAKSWRELAAA